MTLCSSRDCAMDAAWRVDGIPLCDRHAKYMSSTRRRPGATTFKKIATPNDQEVHDGE